MFKLVHEHIDGKEYIIPGRAPAPERTVDLRLIVSADKFTAQFRTEGQAEYRDAAAGPLPPGSDEQISLQCYNGPAGAQHWIRFTKFRLVEVAEADLSKQK